MTEWVGVSCEVAEVIARGDGVSPLGSSTNLAGHEVINPDRPAENRTLWGIKDGGGKWLAILKDRRTRHECTHEVPAPGVVVRDEEAAS